MIYLLFQPTESRCPTCSLPLCDLETDKNNNKTSVNNDNNNSNKSSDCELGFVCHKFKHFEECELLRSLSNNSKQPVPREVSQLAIIATRMAKVVDKEEVALLMDHLEDRVQLPNWETTLRQVLQPLAKLRPDLGDERQIGELLGR